MIPFVSHPRLGIRWEDKHRVRQVPDYYVARPCSTLEGPVSLILFSHLFLQRGELNRVISSDPGLH